MSRDVQRRLLECYVDRSRTPNEGAFPAAVGGQWFCPGCGTPATETSPGDVRCPSCRLSLAEFIYALVEWHFHAPD